MYTLSYIDTCNSQYFSGHHLPVVQVMVDRDSTYGTIKNDLLEYETYEHLWEAPYFVTLDSPDGFDDDAYRAAVHKAFDKVLLTMSWDATLDSSEDDEDYDVYAYFVIQVEDE